MAAPSLPALLAPEIALAAAYLRRLGFPEREIAGLCAGQPLAPDAKEAKGLLNDLVRRHVLRVPFENLEPPTTAALGSRGAAERIALGLGGGVSQDINTAFAWLLKTLGANCRLCAAFTPTSAGGSDMSAQASHVVIVVELSSGPCLADPGFHDPPRACVVFDASDGSDDLSYLEVVSAEPDAGCPEGASMVLRRKRDVHSLCRHVFSAENAGLDEAEADWATVYAFRPQDDLTCDAAEIQAGRDLTRGSGRLLCLGLSRGSIVLSANRMRKVEVHDVVQDVAVESDDAWRRMAAEILAMPFVSPPASGPGPKLRTNGSNGYPVGKSASQDAATAKAQNMGIVDLKSIAVGGAGQGGGLGLNAPGFGPKVKHFATGGATTGGNKAIVVSDEVKGAWQQVLDASDPTAWVFCEYSGDGKTLELSRKGEGGLKAFKAELGDAIAWGGFRCFGVDKRGGVECKRPKFVFVQYKPETASAMKKAKQGPHKGDVKDALAGAHLDVVVEHIQDLDEELLITKLQAATGAHKPNGYEFEEGVFIEADFYGLGIGKDCKAESTRN